MWCNGSTQKADSCFWGRYLPKVWRYGQAVKTLVFLTRIPSSNLGSVIKNDTANLLKYYRRDYVRSRRYQPKNLRVQLWLAFEFFLGTFLEFTLELEKGLNFVLDK